MAVRITHTQSRITLSPCHSRVLVLSGFALQKCTNLIELVPYCYASSTLDLKVGNFRGGIVSKVPSIVVASISLDTILEAKPQVIPPGIIRIRPEIKKRVWKKNGAPMWKHSTQTIKFRKQTLPPGTSTGVFHRGLAPSRAPGSPATELQSRSTLSQGLVLPVRGAKLHPRNGN